MFKFVAKVMMTVLSSKMYGQQLCLCKWKTEIENLKIIILIELRAFLWLNYIPQCMYKLTKLLTRFYFFFFVVVVVILLFVRKFAEEVLNKIYRKKHFFVLTLFGWFTMWEGR